MDIRRCLAALALASMTTGIGSAYAQLEIGTRVLYVVLDEDSRNGNLIPGRDPARPTSYTDRFLGTINTLDVEQGYLPIRLYVQYFINTNIGFGISYDRVEVDTRDEFKSDGILTMDGPIVYAVGRLPGEKYTPFAELGAGIFGASYDPDPAWEDAGPFGRRVMDIDDTVAFVIGLGCDISVSERFSINLYARAVLNATLDAKAYYSKDASRTPFAVGEFPLDNYGIGIGVKYAFR